MNRRNAPELDLLIIGGGPAGLAAAIAARREGLRVRLVDGRRPPIDKACGEGLMPHGAACLRLLGVDIDGVGRSFRGIRYIDDAVVAEARFAGPPGLGLRRLVLQRRLVERAERVGVELDWNRPVRALAGGSAETDRGPIRARFIVGADGLHSRVRRWVGLEAGAGRRRRFGISRHYAIRPWSDLVEVHWSDGAEAYVTPLSEDEVGVAVLADGGGHTFDRLLGRFPRLERRLAAAPRTAPDRGAGPLHQRARGVAIGRFALIGDASGYLDAITGEGLTLAFVQAIALGPAIAAGSLATYAAAHRRSAATPWRITRWLLRVERRPWARRWLIRALARDPVAFSRCLDAMGGDPAQGLRPIRTLPLIWRLTRP